MITKKIFILVYFLRKFLRYGYYRVSDYKTLSPIDQVYRHRHFLFLVDFADFLIVIEILTYILVIYFNYFF